MSRLKIRFFTNWNPCNFACEYCITSERDDGTVEEERSQRPLPILTRIGKNLARPHNALSKALTVIKHPSMLIRQPKSLD